MKRTCTCYAAAAVDWRGGSLARSERNVTLISIWGTGETEMSFAVDFNIYFNVIGWTRNVIVIN